MKVNFYEISLKQLWFLSHLFVFQVLLLAIDVFTDFENALKLLREDGHARANQTGLGLMVFIFVPGIWAALSLPLSLIRSKGQHKSSLELLRKIFKEFVEELPVFNIFCRFNYFLQLCFMDTNCPHNYGLVIDIRCQIISASLNEAFLESAPQLVIQASYLIYSYDSSRTVDVIFILGVASSLLSCCLASVNLFLFSRPGYYSDCRPSWKTCLIMFPLVLISILGGILLWSSAWSISPPTAGAAFLSIFITAYIIALFQTCRGNNLRSPKYLMNELASSWVTPFVPWRPSKKKTVRSLFLKLVGAAALPAILILVVSRGWEKDYAYGGNFIIASICLGSSIFCLLVHILGNPKIFYSMSKVLMFFGLKAHCLGSGY